MQTLVLPTLKGLVLALYASKTDGGKRSVYFIQVHLLILFYSRQFAVVKRVPKCGHAISACKSCVLHHVTAELGRHGRLNKVSCLDCTNPLGHYYIKALLSKVDFRRWGLYLPSDRNFSLDQGLRRVQPVG